MKKKITEKVNIEAFQYLKSKVKSKSNNGFKHLERKELV